jgi:hypothetical protein
MALAFLPIQKQTLLPSNDTSNILNHVYLLAGYEDGSVIAWSWSNDREATTPCVVWRVATHKEPSE